jgi:hypothetical protein
MIPSIAEPVLAPQSRCQKRQCWRELRFAYVILPWFPIRRNARTTKGFPKSVVPFHQAAPAALPACLSAPTRDGLSDPDIIREQSCNASTALHGAILPASFFPLLRTLFGWRFLKFTHELHQCNLAEYSFKKLPQ